jgi:hypothetical protein
MVREVLGEMTVGDTLTNVVIPTFDVRLLQPVIFSTYDVCACAIDVSCLV